MLTNPFLSPPSSPPGSRWITERDFAALYGAAEFAAIFELWFDTTVTISWRLMGPEVEGDVPRFFGAFTKCLRDWLEERVLPAAWIYVHECGKKVGLHTHLNLYIPGDPGSYRSAFRAWARGWVQRQIGRRAPNAIRVRGPKKETPWLHWLTTSYLMKGYDRSAIVQSGRNSPDGRAVLLGDLIAWPWEDPGTVVMKQRVGSSRSLGPERRAVGVPGGMDYLRSKKIVALTPELAGRPGILITDPITAFRSKYEDGIRDARLLYPPQFYEMVTGRSAAFASLAETMAPEDESFLNGLLLDGGYY